MRSHSRLCGTVRCGFSLVELLTVVAIIMIMLALLLPSLGMSKEAGYHATCQSNLKQLYETLVSYRPQVLTAGIPQDELVALPGGSGWVGFVVNSDAGPALICPNDRTAGGHGGGDVAVSGDIEMVEPPPILIFTHNESEEGLDGDDKIYAFIERESFTLPSDLSVNTTEPSYVDNTSDDTPGTIPAGTTVDVFFIHHDPEANNSTQVSGVMVFPGEILGFIHRQSELTASDAMFGLPGTQYDTGHSARDFENGAEHIELHEDRSTLTIHKMHSTHPGENMRVITTPGGTASYGINDRITHRWPRPDQVLLVDYEKSVVNVPQDDFDEYLAPRHFDKCNTLFGDGSIQLLAPDELDPTADLWKSDGHSD